MQPVHCNLLFCDRIIPVKGKYNLEGVFYRVHALKFPCRHKCFILVGWYGVSGSHTFGLRFLPPDRSGTLFEIMSQPFRLSESRPYYNAVIEAALPLNSEGAYWFEVLLNQKSLGFFPIHVELLSPNSKTNLSH